MGRNCRKGSICSHLLLSISWKKCFKVIVWNIETGCSIQFEMIFRGVKVSSERNRFNKSKSHCWIIPQTFPFHSKNTENFMTSRMLICIQSNSLSTSVTGILSKYHKLATNPKKFFAEQRKLKYLHRAYRHLNDMQSTLYSANGCKSNKETQRKWTEKIRFINNIEQLKAKPWYRFHLFVRFISRQMRKYICKKKTAVH